MLLWERNDSTNDICCCILSVFWHLCRVLGGQHCPFQSGKVTRKMTVNIQTQQCPTKSYHYGDTEYLANVRKLAVAQKIFLQLPFSPYTARPKQGIRLKCLQALHDTVQFIEKMSINQLSLMCKIAEISTTPLVQFEVICISVVCWIVIVSRFHFMQESRAPSHYRHLARFGILVFTICLCKVWSGNKGTKGSHEIKDAEGWRVPTRWRAIHWWKRG